MSKRICDNCREYTVLGTEGSGLFRDGLEWRYNIGRCNQPKSVHGGFVAPKFGDSFAKQQVPRKTLPGWCGCEYFKKRR